RDLAQLAVACNSAGFRPAAKLYFRSDNGGLFSKCCESALYLICRWVFDTDHSPFAQHFHGFSFGLYRGKKNLHLDSDRKWRTRWSTNVNARSAYVSSDPLSL